ncbi:hypothetical protein [Streptomyces sp. NPDC058155]|uniref:hypothetical protein n=1 Tax=Streptomyces sp. NPDC058155 TaxID=3346359 RepID=UPI0036E19CF7
MLRLLVSADLDAYEARQSAAVTLLADADEAGFVTSYQEALSSGDDLGARRVLALAAVFDAANPDLPSAVAELQGFDYPAAA